MVLTLGQAPLQKKIRGVLLHLPTRAISCSLQTAGHVPDARRGLRLVWQPSAVWHRICILCFPVLGNMDYLTSCKRECVDIWLVSFLGFVSVTAMQREKVRQLNEWTETSSGTGWRPCSILRSLCSAWRQWRPWNKMKNLINKNDSCLCLWQLFCLKQGKIKS